MYISRLLLTNLRAITATDLNFRHPAETAPAGQGLSNNVNLLLGDNGTGKTTILKGIALAVLSRVIEGSGYRPYHLVRHGSREASAFAELLFCPQDTAVPLPDPAPRIESHLSLSLRGSYHELDWKRRPEVGHTPSPDRVVVGTQESDRLWERLYQDKEPGLLLLGYGATRRAERSDVFDPSLHEKQRSVRFQRVAGLFEDHLALIPLTGWFPKLPGRRRKEIISLINKLLPNGMTFRAENRMDEEDFLFEQDSATVPFGALSDGFRAYVALITDMLYHLHSASERNDRLAELPGIVLIDEIDLHLHPSWQRRVLTQLSETLPRLQFIATSHSAIVAGTARRESLLVLEREDKKIVVHRPLQSLYGRSADEILLSRYFGLPTTRAPGAVDEARLLSRQALEGDTEAAMKFLRMMANRGGEAAEPKEPPLQRTKRFSALKWLADERVSIVSLVLAILSLLVALWIYWLKS